MQLLFQQLQFSFNTILAQKKVWSLQSNSLCLTYIHSVYLIAHIFSSAIAC